MSLKSFGCHELRVVRTKKNRPYYFDRSGRAWVHNGGRVRMCYFHSCTNPGGHFKKGTTHYYEVGNGDFGHLTIHRSVALAYPEICGVPDLFRCQTDHINGNKFDNRAVNLRWVTDSENKKARFALEKKHNN
ncbi:MAG: HNH endonuclease [Paludibacteraceae bacterium]|nr:HNH endonuclease [Paludibacteraceae bacterium]